MQTQAPDKDIDYEVRTEHTHTSYEIISNNSGHESCQNECESEMDGVP